MREGNTNGLRHGHARGGKVTGEWAAWKGMRQRCLSPSHKRYPLYGGRGISVCDRWRDSFEAFLEDMGPKPSPRHSIEREDVNGNYGPDNCRWATQREQCRNQRRNRIVVYQGRTMTLAELVELTGIEHSHLRYHLAQGRSPDEAVAFIRRKQGLQSC